MRTFGIIITFKAPHLLRSCLSSLDGQCDSIWIQDNSDDETRLYTRGVNIGLRHGLSSGAKYLLICCDDVTVLPSCVSLMADFLDSNPKCGIAMPLQLEPGTEQVSCGGCTVAFPYGKHIIEPLTHDLYKKPYESFWANGACFLLRAEAARECGLLDENMRFICSDADYSFTLRARGWTVHVVPEARCEHKPRGALTSPSIFIEKTKDEDSLYFMQKWITGGIFQMISAEGPKLDVKQVQMRLHELNWRLKHGYTKDSGGE